MEVSITTFSDSGAYKKSKKHRYRYLHFVSKNESEFTFICSPKVQYSTFIYIHTERKFLDTHPHKINVYLTHTPGFDIISEN